MHDEAPPFRSLYLPRALRPDGARTFFVFFVPIPKVLPYRAQPVYESNAAMATSESLCRLSIAVSGGVMSAMTRPQRGSSNLSTAAQMFPKSWSSFRFELHGGCNSPPLVGVGSGQSGVLGAR